MGSSQRNKRVGRAEAFNLSFGHCLASQHGVPLLPPAEKEVRPAEDKKRGTPYSIGHGDVTCGILRADALGPNVDFLTVAISVEETTEEINAHHFQGRVLYSGSRQ